MTRLFRFSCMSLMLFGLSGCGSKPSPDLYVLRAADDQITPLCASGRSLTIEHPIVADEYNSKRIAVRTAPSQLTYYTGANWASPLPDQLENFLGDALERSHAFSSVNGVDEDNTGMISLLVRIRVAEVIPGDLPSAHLRMNATLIDTASGKTIASLPINETVPAAANHMPEIVAAFDEAAANAANAIAKAGATHCGAARHKHAVEKLD